jgi:hypothetical protein
MNAHKWVMGAPVAKYNDDGSVSKYVMKFVCTVCGTEVRLGRPNSLVSFDLPLPDEMRDNHIDADCDMTQVRQVMES